jgi:NAD(P)-dependent dehydrogenase (short-subunit alcohol dehydrogenase family)
MEGQLAGKVALVTGGGSGIGQATALAFAREGARVALAGRSLERLEETKGLVHEAGGDAFFIQTDVSRAVEVEAMVKGVVERYGRLDCAFNNAGIEGVTVPFHEYSEEVWDQVIAVNLKGVWLSMKYEIAQMLAQGSGNIVNNSSVAGLVGGRNAAYVASKHGIVGLTKTAALVYATAGIRVNAVCPGAVATPMAERTFARAPETEAVWLSAEPMGRFALPSEIAEAVVWLCSDAASFVTGVALPVDGGLVAR